jgi:hypothetical protein
MPLVKLTIRAEPIEVDERELAILRGQNILERVLDGDVPDARPEVIEAPPAPGAGLDADTDETAQPPDPTEPAADAAGEKE